jgi:hypothetical protein
MIIRCSAIRQRRTAKRLSRPRGGLPIRCPRARGEDWWPRSAEHPAMNAGRGGMARIGGPSIRWAGVVRVTSIDGTRSSPSSRSWWQASRCPLSASSSGVRKRTSKNWQRGRRARRRGGNRAPETRSCASPASRLVPTPKNVRRSVMSAACVASEQRYEQLSVRAAPAGHGVPARACPVAGDRPLGNLAVLAGPAVMSWKAWW